MHLRVGDWALLRLHQGYSIPSATSSKLSQQFTGPFKVTERVGKLAYRLALPGHWTVHPVFTIAQLEPAPAPSSDPFNRPVPEQPPSIFVEGDTDEFKSFEVERLLNKRIIKKGRGMATEYLVRWKGYGPEYDMWYNVKHLGDADILINEYEEAMGRKAPKKASVKSNTSPSTSLPVILPPIAPKPNASVNEERVLQKWTAPSAPPDATQPVPDGLRRSTRNEKRLVRYGEV